MKENPNKLNENEISFLQNLLLQDLDRSLDMRNRLEAKAIGYMAGIALILNLLYGFIKDVKNSEAYCCCSTICLITCITSFIIGTILLLLFSIMLFPKPTSFFFAEDFGEFTNSEELDRTLLLKESCDFIKTNNKTISILNKFNLIISVGLIILGILFLFDCMLYFYITIR